MVVIVCGLPGSGKSYFASHLASTMGAAYLNSDATRKQLFERRSYSTEETRMVYDALLKVSVEKYQEQKNIIADATFSDQSLLKEFFDALPGLRLIEVRAGESLIRKRLTKQREVSEADFDVYETLKSKWQPIPFEHLILESTNDNLAQMIEKAMAYLSQ